MRQIKRISIGEIIRRFPAGSYNAMADMVERLAAGEPCSRAPARGLPVDHNITIPLHNSGGTVYDVYAVLGFTSIATSTPDSSTPNNQEFTRPALTAAVPVVATHGDNIVVLQAPLNPNGVAQGLVVGVTWVKVNVSNANDTFARIKDSDATQLQSATSGPARIIWKESGTGTKWALVHLQAAGYRLIRGQSVGAQSGSTILIDNVVPLAGGLDPSGGNAATAITAYNTFGQSFTDNQVVDAVSSPRAGGTAANWETLGGGGGTAAPPLRRFELTAAKATTDATATAKFLDDAGNMVGDPVTLYDPMGKFYGKAAGYAGAGQGFRGVALERADLGAVEPNRWEIVVMEGYADWVVLTYAGSPTNAWQLTSFGGGDQWNWKRPVVDNAAITVSDPLGVLASPKNGEKIIAFLVNPDTSPPTYQERENTRQPKQLTLDTTGNSLRVKLKFADDTEIEATLSVATLLNAMASYNSAADQSIGHDAGGATQWQTDGSC